jgi:hypothetical protein
MSNPCGGASAPPPFSASGGACVLVPIKNTIETGLDFSGLLLNNPVAEDVRRFLTEHEGS